MYTYIYISFIIFQEENHVKPITPESCTSIKNSVVDPASALSVNSLDGRLQLITKSTSSDPTIIVNNIDGTTAAIQLPSGFQGSFILPLASDPSKSTSVTSSGFTEFFFIQNGIPSPTNTAYGVTLENFTNGGKLYFTNSSGYLSKVSSSSLPRVNYGFAVRSGSWEKKGLLFEPPSFNLINTTWNNTPFFGATGATAEIVDATVYGAGYWDSSTISGMTVWKLSEISTSGFSAENTITIPPSAFSLGSFKPSHVPAAGVSWSTFMVSAFFTGPNKVSGITKDIIQIWLATSPSGAIKKSIYFDLNSCSPVAVSSGGSTLAYYATEPYANGWCRCMAAVGLTGQTWPASQGIPQFGFSTARPDESGGYTFGRLLGASAGSMYFSGLKIDLLKDYAFGNVYANKLAPSSYVDPKATTQYSNCYVQYLTPKTPSWFFPSTSYLTGGMQSSCFYDLTINSAAGITEGAGGGNVVFFNGQLINETRTNVGELYAQSWVISRGLARTGTPIPRINYYFLQRTSGAPLFGGVAALAGGDKDYVHTINPGSVTVGFTSGERFKFLITAATGSWKSYVNGMTGVNTTGFTAALYPSDTNFHTGWQFTIVPQQDKVMNIMNWGHTPKILTEAQGIAATSFGLQGAPIFKFSGSDGGYNEVDGNYQNIADIVGIQNNNSTPLPPSPYPPDQTVLVP